MGSLPRVIATLVIWTAITIVLTDGSVGADNGTIAILGVTALLSTIAVWVSGRDSAHAEPRYLRPAISAHKRKRGDRTPITRLVDVLDEDEANALMDELRARLSPTDGETVSLEHLLAEREDAAARRA